MPTQSISTEVSTVRSLAKKAKDESAPHDFLNGSRWIGFQWNGEEFRQIGQLRIFLSLSKTRNTSATSRLVVQNRNLASGLLMGFSHSIATNDNHC
jgi:hypothetical protein